MSAPRRARQRHIHLPSVHVRTQDDGTGFDYEEDLYVRGARVERVIRFRAIECGVVTLERVTRDLLCAEELADLEASLPVLMDEGNLDARATMESLGRAEYARQLRIAQGQEHACTGCGCSETRACSGGCLWLTETRCSRCI